MTVVMPDNAFSSYPAVRINHRSVGEQCVASMPMPLSTGATDIDDQFCLRHDNQPISLLRAMCCHFARDNAVTNQCRAAVISNVARRRQHNMTRQQCDGWYTRHVNDNDAPCRRLAIGIS